MNAVAAQRLISLTIGALFAMALIVTVTFLFGTTQPRTGVTGPASVSD